MDEIELVPSDPRWPALFEAEAARVRALLLGLALRIEHIGSTAVPGLPAKPIIDMLALVPSLAEARGRAVAPLEADGYAFWADNPDPERMFFVRGLPPAAPRRTHHLHLTESAAVVERHLAFRDRLRADPKALAAYAALKVELATRFRDDREAYTEAKSAHIAGVLAAPTP